MFIALLCNFNVNVIHVSRMFHINYIKSFKGRYCKLFGGEGSISRIATHGRFSPTPFHIISSFG